MSDAAAICSNCKQATTGKVHDPYWCSDCKIRDLEEGVEFYKEQCSNAEKHRDEWLKKYSEESILKTKYRNAFEALFEKISAK